jgi:hypothetical protein
MLNRLHCIHFIKKPELEKELCAKLQTALWVIPQNRVFEISLLGDHWLTTYWKSGINRVLYPRFY